MKKQRLLELAGISSNMNNPSQEPYTEIPSDAESPTGAPGINGQNELGDASEMDPIEKMRQQVQKGLESPEAAMSACEAILAILDEFDKMEDGAEPDEANAEPEVTSEPNGQQGRRTFFDFK